MEVNLDGKNLRYSRTEFRIPFIFACISHARTAPSTGSAIDNACDLSLSEITEIFSAISLNLCISYYKSFIIRTSFSLAVGGFWKDIRRLRYAAEDAHNIKKIKDFTLQATKSVMQRNFYFAIFIISKKVSDIANPLKIREFQKPLIFHGDLT